MEPHSRVFTSPVQHEAKTNLNNMLWPYAYDHRDRNACQYQPKDIVPQVIGNCQAHYNLNTYSSSRHPYPALPNNGLGNVDEEAAVARAWEAPYRSYPLLPVEQHRARHFDYASNLCHSLKPRAQEQGAYTQTDIKPPPVYTPYPVQQQQKYSENSENNDPSHDDVSIAAPVPLSFSARSKDVLYSMISNASQSRKLMLPENVLFTSSPFYRQRQPESEQETITSTVTLHDPETDTASAFCASSPNLPHSSDDFFGRHAATYPSIFNRNVSQSVNTHTQHLQIQQPKPVQPLLIKSISPATLIALTEPFLMDWCTNPDWTLTPSDYDANLKSTISQLHHPTNLNSWGY